MDSSQNGRLLGGWRLHQHQNHPVAALPGTGDADVGRQGSATDRAGVTNDEGQRRVRLGLRLLQVPDKDPSVREGEHRLEHQKRPIGSEWYVVLT